MSTGICVHCYVSLIILECLNIFGCYIYICIQVGSFFRIYLVRFCVVPRGKPLFLVIGSGPAVGDLRRPTITRCCQQEIASVAEHISLGLLRQDLARNRTTSSKIGDVQRLQYLGLPGLNGRHKNGLNHTFFFANRPYIECLSICLQQIEPESSGAWVTDRHRVPQTTANYQIFWGRRFKNPSRSFNV